MQTATKKKQKLTRKQAKNLKIWSETVVRIWG